MGNLERFYNGVDSSQVGVLAFSERVSSSVISTRNLKKAL